MKQKLTRFLLWIFGWQVIGENPNLKKYIIIFAPHTSNWDFVMAQMAGFALNVSAKYFAKASLFRFPYRFFFEFLGGIPIDRTQENNVVDFAVALFKEREELVLALAPEGTRSWVERWKSGFYHIAVGAKIPIVLCFFDYAKKEVGVAQIFEPSGNIDRDMAKIAAIYQEKSGRNPEHYNPKID